MRPAESNVPLGPKPYRTCLDATRLPPKQAAAPVSAVSHGLLHCVGAMKSGKIVGGARESTVGKKPKSQHSGSQTGRQEAEPETMLEATGYQG